MNQPLPRLSLADLIDDSMNHAHSVSSSLDHLFTHLLDNDLSPDAKTKMRARAEQLRQIIISAHACALGIESDLQSDLTSDQSV